MIRKLATVSVYVQDQQQALEFWTDKVGFSVLADHPMGPDARWIEVGPQGAHTRLVLYPRALAQDWTERKLSVVFECDDIEATVQKLADAGVVIKQPPKEMPWGIYAVFADLDGHGYVLYQPHA